MYRGRPSFESLQRRHGERGNVSDTNAAKWLTEQIDNLNPGDHFIIPLDIQKHLIASTIRAKLALINRTPPFNIKLHIPGKKDRKHNPNWYVWYCPNPNARLNRFGKLIDTNEHTQRFPVQSKPELSDTPPSHITPHTYDVGTKLRKSKSSGSITFPLSDILAHLGMNIAQWSQLTFDYQQELKIKTGIALRNERKASQRLQSKFN